ncbi:response regulator transcription factor [Streptomyces sp. 4503]|uniref:Response regulator transcription factor n=1 Tax=Streptomyces niphimycinicus TaxID=2842201 RepID=A0ABS6CHX2_9ACTN|nr:two-component system response regulator CseB [Streptomyces niphimycinicus]MBU3866340.1 response regulator transcription factor [Streptomyces niphimycinicus]
MHVLLVEDDELIRHSFATNLERYGYTVTDAADGLEGLELFRAADPDEPFDLLLLDVMLPALDGIGLCRRVRETSHVPILMMSARGDGLDVVSGLEAGADDYVVKPVETGVLLARIRSVLRRASWNPAPSTTYPAPPTDDVLTFGDLSVDTSGMTVTLADRPIALTPTELKLMLEFAARPEAIIDRHTLLRDVWDHGWDADTRVVDLAVQRLRKKIGHDRIETVRGFGYKFRR